jgi:hypothetical protein
LARLLTIPPLTSALARSSLQEIAPLSYAFIGSYFLSPYYARLEEALNLAAGKASTAEPTSVGNDEADDARPLAARAREPASSRPYTLVRAHNVGMTGIMLFAKNRAAIKHVEHAECGFGAADMGNKGAVGLRIIYCADDASGDGEAPSTELTFVATHLAAMEWNLKRRNANWRAIVSGLTFANPRSVLPGVFPPDDSAPRPDRTGSQYKTQPDSADSSEAEEEANDDQPLLNGDAGPQEPAPLHPEHPHITREHHTTLHDISVFKPTSHLFVAGDLNYRISTTTPPPLAKFPSFDPDSEHYYPAFLDRDQLTQERLAGRTFHGMSEAPVSFGPSYKYNVLSDAAGAVNERAVRAGATVNGVPELPWKFAPHRWPSWCDRVLYLDLPQWVKSKGIGGTDDEALAVRTIAYDLLPVMRTSDHRPVFMRARVPILDAATMRPPPEAEGGEAAEVEADPRVALPVPIDVHAWERRAAARRKEIAVGWSAFLWSTREGAMVLATVLLVGVGSWWLLSAW